MRQQYSGNFIILLSIHGKGRHNGLTQQDIAYNDTVLVVGAKQGIYRKPVDLLLPAVMLSSRAST